MYISTIVCYTAITVTATKVLQVPQSDLKSPYYPILPEPSENNYQRQIQFLNCNPDSSLTAFDSVILKIRCRNLTPELPRIYGDTEVFPQYENIYQSDELEPETESEDINDKIKKFVEKYNIKKANIRKRRLNTEEQRAIIENEINDKFNQIDDVDKNDVAKDKDDENELEHKETKFDDTTRMFNKYYKFDTDPLLVFKINLIYLTDSINKRVSQKTRKGFIKRALPVDDGINYEYADLPSYGELYFIHDIDKAEKSYLEALNKFYLESQEDPARKLSKRARNLQTISANFQSRRPVSDILQPASKRVFSLLTRWKPFTTLGQDAELRRRFHAYGYFPQFTRHGDIVSAETRASSRPPGSPLRWG